MIIRLPILPPTQNRAFIISRGRFIKSPEARIFDQAIEIEKIKQFRKFNEAHELFKNRLICVDTYYIFLKTRIYGKKNQIKQCDFLNRQKMGHDGLSRCLDIDDMYFKSGIHELITCDHAKDEGLLFKLSIQDQIRSFDMLKQDCKDLGISI